MSWEETAMTWSLERGLNPRPIHGWDSRIDPSVKADIRFQDRDDPEGAQIWLDVQASVIAQGMEPREEPPAPMQSVPYRLENVRPITTDWVREPADLAESGRDFSPMALADDDALDTEEIRNRVASLPDGEIRVGRMTEQDMITEDQFRQNVAEYERIRNRLTRQIYPLGYLDPPTPETVERPDFPHAPATGVESVRVIVRMNNGVEEIFEIDNPTEVQFTMNVETDYADLGDMYGRRIPTLRELRELLISIGSPRNWRRLPTRRWQ